MILRRPPRAEIQSSPLYATYLIDQYKTIFSQVKLTCIKRLFECFVHLPNNSHPVERAIQQRINQVYKKTFYVHFISSLCQCRERLYIKIIPSCMGRKLKKSVIGRQLKLAYGDVVDKTIRVEFVSLNAVHNSYIKPF